MSRSPTEIGAPAHAGHVALGARAWSAGLRRSWRRVSGRSQRHTLVIQAQGVLAWRTVPAGDAPPAATTFDGFEAWCAAHRGAEVRVLLSSHLTHSLVIDPSLQLRGVQAVGRCAQQQFVHYHGPHAARWPLALWSDRYGSGATAVHALSVDSLRTTAQTLDVQLLSVEPLWSAGLSSLTTCDPSFASTGRHALALVDGTLVTWLVAEGGRIVALQQRYLDAANTHALASLLDQLLTDEPALATPPRVIGWGLAHSERALPLQARTWAPLTGHGGMRDWVLDSLRSTA